MAGLALAVAAPAHAEDAVGSLRMLPNRMVIPTIAAEVGVTATLNAAYPLLSETSLALRGLPGRRSEANWLGLDGSVQFDARAIAAGEAGAAAPVAFTARLTPWRFTSQSQPIVAAHDLRLGSISVARDRPLDVDLSAKLQVLDWSGGLYLPSNRLGDIDARAVVGIRALGATWHRPVPGSGIDSDFLGANIGGLSGEFVYGRRLADTVTLTGHLGARADWALGTLGAASFSAITDTEVWLAAVSDFGPSYSLRLVASTRTTENPTGRASSAPAATLAWRATW